MFITATQALTRLPLWAVLQRTLFDVSDAAWREFERYYCSSDGRLEYSGGLVDRDGVDDFYEPFFNWPHLYRLGGSADLLVSSKLHWEGVTRQLTELGFVRDEFEVGYDWFHQGESLNFFYSICAADPGDDAFRERAMRFARLYLPDSPTGNYDQDKAMIVAPHTGVDGPRWGVGEVWRTFEADQPGMRVYGIPLRDVAGIDSWEDLAIPGHAARMGSAMQERMGRGDTAVNLAATSLAVNAWLYANDPAMRDWALEYITAWQSRAAANAGVIPDNVGPGGVVGELHGGRWYGGHYGWTWPHGLHSIGAAALVAAVNASILTGDLRALDLARGPLDTVLDRAEMRDLVADQGSLGPGWAAKLGVDDSAQLLLVPFRHGIDGWYDYHPVPLVYPVWLWWLSGEDADRRRLESLRAKSGFDWREVRWFHDKEEQGHEAPWIAFLTGDNPGYPESALQLAIGQVLRRLGLMRAAPHGPPDDDIHWWQRLNPVVTEVLTQLTTGAPPAVYNGGLSLARVTYGDADMGRPGLPPDVGALVSRVEQGTVGLELVNTSVTDRRRVIVQAGAFGEDRIHQVTFSAAAGSYPGDSRDYNIPVPGSDSKTRTATGNRLVVTLPPATTVSLTLSVERRAFMAAHSTFPSIVQQEDQ